MAGSRVDDGLPVTEPRWVTDHGTVRELGAALEHAPVHSLDSESNSGFVYRERLCLLQFNIAGTIWLLDLVAFDDPAQVIERLRGPLESEDVTTWLHGGEFDVGSLKRDFGLALGGVWDTQQAATFLGWEKTGYGAVVERVCDVVLDKAYAHYDWGRRPVEAAALRYAVDDVVYLPKVAERLAQDVEAADLAEEVAIANRAVMGAEWSSPNSRSAIWKLKGAYKLDASALPRLVALWEWREAEAKRLDVPPGRLLHGERILAMARNRVRSKRDLRAMGLRGRSAAYADEILGVLDRAARRPPQVPQRPRGERPAAGEAKRLKKLKEWRRNEAERRGVPQPVVLPPTAVQYLARHGTSDLAAVPQLGAKRIALYGDSLESLLA